jgi:RNA polymerase sigma-70 factor (sigma-E family)
MSAGGPDPEHIPDTRHAEAVMGPVPAVVESAADQAITALYGTQYRPLVGLATLLVGDAHLAEEVVQDAFVATERNCRRLRDHDEALFYLRKYVISGSRSALRRQRVADQNMPKRPADIPRADQGAATQQERSTAVISALRTLPLKQREAVALRFYLDLSEDEAAAAMGISPGAVRSYTARAMTALTAVLKLEM